ncbi:hypothetical protein [Bacillus sp. FJAT-27245]|uniref:hypothetical protein n=1 Tax=Bacillus sp. FJAT-27245 TaxID=1684144 RepID=UPI000AAD8067|nr:hypothetical protein [Bacillus sp. FJAT-27245]
MKDERVVSLAELKLKRNEKNGTTLPLTETADLYAQKFGHEFKSIKQKGEKKNGK